MLISNVVASTVVHPKYHRVSQSEARAAPVRLVIVCSLLLTLIGGMLLGSARTTVHSLQQSAAEKREIRHTGDIVFPMPDGVYCRQISFDNLTAEVREGAIKLCRDDGMPIHARPRRNFSWQQ